MKIPYTATETVTERRELEDLPTDMEKAKHTHIHTFKSIHTPLILPENPPTKMLQN